MFVTTKSFQASARWCRLDPMIRTIRQALIGASIAVGVFAANGPCAVAVTVTQHPLPEYRCGAELCKPAPPTAILADGPSHLLAAAAVQGALYGELATGATPTLTSGPAGQAAQAMTLGPDGNPWIYGSVGNGTEAATVIQDVSSDGATTIYHGADLAGEVVTSMGSGQGGVWLATVGGKLGRFRPGAQVTEVIIPERTRQIPAVIASGAEGSMVFTTIGGDLGEIAASGELRLNPIEDGDSFDGWRFMFPWGVASGPGSTIWFTEANHERIGEETASGELREFAIPDVCEANTACRPAPEYITAGPEGDMWFTDPGDEAVGRVTTQGEVTEYPIPSSTPVSPAEIVTVGDELWFDEKNSTVLGSIDPEGMPSVRPLESPPARTAVAAALAREFMPVGGADELVRVIRRKHVAVQQFSAPEPGTLVIDWMAEASLKPRRTHRKGASHKEHAKASAPAPVLIASGEAAFDLAESKPIEVRITKAGEALLKQQSPSHLTIHATFTGKWAGPVEAAGVAGLR